MKWKSSSFTCQEHKESAPLERQIESFGEWNENCESFICQVYQRESFGGRNLRKCMKVSPVKSIKKVLLWNVKVEVLKRESYENESSTCQEHQESAPLVRQSESFDFLMKWNVMKVSPVKSIKKVLLWNVKVKVCVGGGCECIAAPASHTEQVRKLCWVRMKMLSILAIFESHDFFFFFRQYWPEKLTEALCGEELRRMEDCVLKKVGKPCKDFLFWLLCFLVVFIVVCSRWWASPAKKLLLFFVAIVGSVVIVVIVVINFINCYCCYSSLVPFLGLHS